MTALEFPPYLCVALALALPIFTILILVGVDIYRLRNELCESDQRGARQIANLVACSDNAEAKQRFLAGDVRSLFEMLKGQVSVDLAYKDVGWLIFIANVGGRDMVRIQHVRPEISPKEYEHLVEKLSFDMEHIAFIDGPPHYEEFLMSREQLERRRKRKGR